MIYRPKRDLWVTLIIILVGLVELGMGIFLLAYAISSHQPALLVPAALTGGVGLLLTWFWLGSSYELTEIELIIRFGPLRFALPLEELIDVHSTDRLKADFGWGLTWSLDRLRIRCRGRSLAYWISPDDKQAFIEDLARARPDLKVTEN